MLPWRHQVSPGVHHVEIFLIVSYINYPTLLVIAFSLILCNRTTWSHVSKAFLSKCREFFIIVMEPPVSCAPLVCLKFVTLQI